MFSAQPGKHPHLLSSCATTLACSAMVYTLPTLAGWWSFQFPLLPDSFGELMSSMPAGLCPARPTVTPARPAPLPNSSASYLCTFRALVMLKLVLLSKPRTVPARWLRSRPK
jgi:hypothetical protein